jgi:hypothetical protein
VCVCVNEVLIRSILKCVLLWLCSPLLGLGRFFNLLVFYTVGRTPWTGISQSQGRYLHTGQHRQNKLTQTPMPRVGFKLTIPVFERAKTSYVLDRAATVIGRYATCPTIFCVHRILPILLLTKRPSGVWLTRELTHKRGVLLRVGFMSYTCRESMMGTIWIDKSSCSGFLKIVTA